MLQELDHLPAGFMSATARTLYRVLPAPTLIHLPGIETRPMLVSILLHGNEDVGLRAVQTVLAAHEGGTLPRAMSIFVGNVEAARAGVRRLDDQPDFNRIWRTETAATPFEQMAAEVVARMKRRDVFVVVDLHNNSGKNPLYSCLNGTEDRHVRLARRFSSLAVLIHSQPSLGAAFSPLCPTVSCECGEIGHLQGMQRAAMLIEDCLQASPASFQGEAEGTLDIFQAFAVLKVADNVVLGGEGDTEGVDIRLLPDIESLNFSKLQAGHVIATTSAQLAVEPLQAFALSGEPIEGIFVRTGTQVRLAIDTIAAMLTPDVRAIRQDCLGYLMRRVPQPVR